MKILFILLILTQFILSGAYNIGDVVSDFSFESTNINASGGVVVNKNSLYQILAKNKIFVLDLSNVSCHPCIVESEELEKIWKLYESSNKLYMISSIYAISSYESLNSSGWRTHELIKTPLTYDLTDGKLYSSQSKKFNLIYTPHYIVIGVDKKLAHSSRAIPSHQLLDSVITATTTSVEELKDNKIMDLVGSYPNPFNPSTTIFFSMAKADLVRLTIYNAKGEVIKVLLNSNLSAGSHAINFNAGNLNSGLYFYQIKNSSETITKKVILQK